MAHTWSEGGRSRAAFTARPFAPCAAGPASPATLLFWSAIWTTMRPYLAFVSGAAALVGLAFSEATRLQLAIGLVPLFLCYGFGQGLTDCFQTDTDAISAPYRPLVRGLLSRAQVLTVSVGGLVASAAVLASLNRQVLVPAALAVTALALYTPLKRTWWGGPPCNAAAVALVPLMARMVDGRTLAEALAGRGAGAFVAATCAVFLGYADFVVTGYLKDVSADRATGYRTFPVAFGWTATAVYGDALAVATVGAAAVALTRSAAGPAAWALLAAAALTGARAHLRVHGVRAEDAAHGPITGVLRALLLVCAAMVTAARPGWLPGLGLLLAAFELALRRRPERTQV